MHHRRRSMILIDMRHRPLPPRDSLDISERLPAIIRPDIRHLGVGDGRHEALGLPRLADLGVELVDLLEREALGLVDGEVDESATDEAEAAPDEEDFGLQVSVPGARVDHVRGGVGDGPVEQPVGGGGHGEGFGAGLEREELARDDPGDGAPGAGEEEDVHAHEGDEDLVGDERAGRGADDGDDELAHAHADGAEEEERAPAPLLDHVEAGKGGEDVDDVGDQADDEGVGDAGALEEGGAVVEDEVDAGKLLEGLEAAAGGEPLAHGAFEAVDVGRFAQAQLVLVVGFDLGQFLDQRRVVDVEAAEAGEGFGGGFVVAALDVEARRLRQDQHSGDQDEGPGELYGDGNPV